MGGRINLAIGCLLLLIAAVSHAQGPGAGKPRKWIDSFDGYKSQMRPLPRSAAMECEAQLARILRAIDANQTCSMDTDCTLIGEEPFGHTVPVRTVSAGALSQDMRQFRTTCNDESNRHFYNKDSVHEPVCVHNRCMVRSSLKR